MTLEEMKVVIKAETTGLNSELDKTKSKVQSFASTTGKATSSVGSSFNVMGAAGAAVLTMLVKKFTEFSKKAIQAASDLEEVQNVVEVSFGNMSYAAEAFAKTALDTFGISEYTAKSVSSTFMAMGGSLGIARQEAADMSLQLTGLAADMGSFYNKDIEDTALALQSIFTGQTESLRKYGIVLTETNLNEFLRQRGLQQTVKDLTEAQKVQLRYQYVMNATAQAQGDFARTASSWSNQTKLLKEQTNQLMTTLGGGFKTIVKPVLEETNQLMGWLVEKAEKWTTLIFGNTTETSGGAVVESIVDAGESFADYFDAAESSAAQIKRDLMGFDELNLLTGGLASGVGGVASGGGVSAIASPVVSALGETGSSIVESIDAVEDDTRSLLGLVNSYAYEKTVDSWKQGIKDDITNGFNSVLEFLGWRTPDIPHGPVEYESNAHISSSGAEHSGHGGSFTVDLNHSGHGGSFTVVKSASMLQNESDWIANAKAQLYSGPGASVQASYNDALAEKLAQAVKEQPVVIQLDGDVIAANVTSKINALTRSKGSSPVAIMA